MADADLGINIRVKGGDEVKRSLKDLVKDVKSAERDFQMPGAGRGRVTPATATTAARARQGGGGGGQGLATSFAGNFFAQMATQAFSAIKQSIVEAFDPVATSQERNARLAQTGLNAIPLVGDLAAGLYGQFKKGELTAIGRTRARLMATFGDALASREDQESLRPAVERAAKIFGEQERRRFKGEELIADVISNTQVFNKDSATNAAGQDAGGGKEQVEQLKLVVDGINGLVEYFTSGRFVSDIAAGGKELDKRAGKLAFDIVTGRGGE